MNILAGTQKKRATLFSCQFPWFRETRDRTVYSTQNRTEIWYFHLKKTPAVGVDIPEKGTTY